MKKLVSKSVKFQLILFFLCFGITALNAQNEKVKVKAFEEVIISPHIEVVFKKSNEESVVIKNSKVPREKVNIEVDDETLHIYLEGAKTFTKSKKSDKEYTNKEPIYKGTQLQVVVNYKSIRDLSIRGEEVIKVEDMISVKDFEMSLYGEAKIYLKGLESEEFSLSTYGESYLEIESGEVASQKYKCYGESTVFTEGLESRETSISAYGENKITVNVSDRLKVTAFGDASIRYKGNPDIKKGLNIGDTAIQKIN